MVQVDRPTAALAEAAGGRHTRAAELLREAATASNPGRAVDAAVVLHRQDLAREIAEGTDELSDPTRARMLAEEGEYSAALRALSNHRSALAQVVEGDLRVLNPATRTDRPIEKLTVALPVQRTCHFVTTALPEAQTGYTLRTKGITDAQRRAGLQVDVISRIGFPVDQGHLTAARTIDLDGVTYHRLLPHRPLSISADERLNMAVDESVTLLRRLQPQIVHAHSKHDNAQVAIATGRRLGVPVVYEVRGFLEETWRSHGGSVGSERYRLTRQAETQCMREADVVVTLSATMRDEIVSRGIPPHKVHLVPNAVGSAFLDDPPDRSRARAQLKLPDDARIVGLAGTLNRYEGLDTVINALAVLADPDVLLLVVGDGPDRHRLELLARKQGVRAHFTGRVPHHCVRAHIAAMDLFCVPRHHTPVTRVVPPMKPLEALATGVPLIMSDLPPLKELLTEVPDMGWIVEVDAAPKWAAELHRRLYDPLRLVDAGRAGREWILTARTWAHMARRYDDIYAAAFGNTSAPEHCGEGREDG
ncbi:glycosyltransferase family 4 protein [Enemella sp. A6]|uniref:glycosyltransferase family 4 protein n=1 Tax=Enemella sp. A6 TaxID=3440152 RepID=UPI003EB6957D